MLLQYQKFSVQGGRGRGRGRGRGSAKVDKLPLQQAVYLGSGKHPMLGRCLLGLVDGSRLVPGVTFMKRFPEVFNSYHLTKICLIQN